MNETSQELGQRAVELLRQAERIVDSAKTEKRDLAVSESREVDRLIAEHDELADRIAEMNGRSPHKRTGGLAERLSRIGVPVNEPPREPLGRQRDDGTLRVIRSDKPEDRRFSTMLRADERHTGGYRSFGEMASLVMNRMSDERLKRSMSEGVVSDGGALVPPAYASQVWDTALESEVVRPRATILDMSKYPSNELNVPAWVIGDHSSNLYGGISTYWKHEGATLTDSDPEPRMLKFVAKKLTGLCKVTDELIQDAPGLISDLTHVFGGSLGFELDDKFLTGSGSGEPKGILNAACLKEVSKEGGQTATTFTYQNAVDMLAGLPPGSYKRAAWFCHPSVVPQLATMSITIGTAGSHIPVLKESNGQWTLLTLPVVFTEKLPALGTAGDVLLADMSQYAIATRSELRVDTSIHPYFTSGHTAMRFVTRLDAQPAWDEALTLKDGSTTVSPFVVCETRS